MQPSAVVGTGHKPRPPRFAARWALDQLRALAPFATHATFGRFLRLQLEDNRIRARPDPFAFAQTLPIERDDLSLHVLTFPTVAAVDTHNTNGTGSGGFSDGVRAEPWEVGRKDPRRTLLDVGRRIAEVRIKTGLTQEEFAERVARISLKYLQRIEAGRANLTVLTLAKFAARIGVEVKELFEPPISREIRRGRPKTTR
jgi:DNA-binding XRE family transcriptional regulator